MRRATTLASLGAAMALPTPLPATISGSVRAGEIPAADERVH
jgi:hypothetical protein